MNINAMKPIKKYMKSNDNASELKGIESKTLTPKFLKDGIREDIKSIIRSVDLSKTSPRESIRKLKKASRISEKSII